VTLYLYAVVKVGGGTVVYRRAWSVSLWRESGGRAPG